MVPLDDVSKWWAYVPAGARWRHPDGTETPTSKAVKTIRSYRSVSLMQWRMPDEFGKRLPTEAEFEYAARGGLDQAPYSWGTEFRPMCKRMANTFQGHFPDSNSRADGYERTRLRYAHSPQTDLAFMIWRATCGSGVRTGIARTTTPYLQQRTRKALQRASIRMNRTRRNEYKRAVRSSVPISTVLASCPEDEGKGRSAPDQATSDSDAH